jgi:transposase-like protein
MEDTNPTPELIETMNPKPRFKRRHFQGEPVLLDVRRYLRYGLSARELEEMRLERGVNVERPTGCRRVPTDAPGIDRRVLPFPKATNEPSRVDGTYIEVRGEGKYSYRGVDSEGNTRDSRPGAGRERKAATGFFGKARKAKPNKRPRGIDVERNAA